MIRTDNKRHVNIPVFIPHEGCPNGCVFCNQKKITGTDGRADRDIRPEIDAVLATVDASAVDAEIAFFGGSFTGIERSVMERLLSDAYSYVERGLVSSVRLSTRPDYIDDEVLDILAKYGVKHIELGIQSADDFVLASSKRGHSAQIAQNACRMITEKGFVLGGQMMIGLPGSSAESEIKTARMICSAGASEARIYPTVVFRETELCEMARRGDYVPLSTEEAVWRAADCYRIFLAAGVKVLRVGLQSGESLSDEKEVYGGANHPALGELCESAVYLGLIKEDISRKLECACGKTTLVIECPIREASKAAGHKKANKKAISRYLAECGIGISEKNIKIAEVFGEPYRVNARFAD